ncbi:hypothetical protein JK621_04470 [Serratia plymuthica]|uniref:hypothetical protein n=1 Tax=Serratia plymuthica TaxID=82996 RepID=UPI001BAF7170|nr:hypothetical protein [Serratia plymuthica]QUY49444.1 hypothetical protein JK621_04470 [Serratia plymuthica]
MEEEEVTGVQVAMVEAVAMVTVEMGGTADLAVMAVMEEMEDLVGRAEKGVRVEGGDTMGMTEKMAVKFD